MRHGQTGPRGLTVSWWESRRFPGERFYNLTMGPNIGTRDPDICPAPAGSLRVTAEPMARAPPAAHARRLVASPGLHSFSGNEDVGDSRQV